MIFFLCFLVLTTIVLPAVTLSQPGQLAVSLAFALMLIFGSFATIHHRVAICFVIGLTIATFAMDLVEELRPSPSCAALDTALKVANLSIMFCVR